MHAPASRRRQVGERLPPLALRGIPDGRPQDLVVFSRDALVLLVVPPPTEAWSGYLERLAGAAPEIEQWYACIRVVAAGDAAFAGELHDRLGGRLELLADAAGDVSRQLGIVADRAALVIADRYGQLYEILEAEREAGLPPVAAVEEWAKFLATQCPECGVIDEPGYGEWSTT